MDLWLPGITVGVLRADRRLVAARMHGVMAAAVSDGRNVLVGVEGTAQHKEPAQIELVVLERSG